jgi:hypothetical protein
MRTTDHEIEKRRGVRYGAAAERLSSHPARELHVKDLIAKDLTKIVMVFEKEIAYVKSQRWPGSLLSRISRTSNLIFSSSSHKL